MNEIENKDRDMIYISNILKELTTTEKSPNGISFFEDDACSSYKTTFQLFSELGEICDLLSDGQLYNIALLLSGLTETMRSNEWYNKIKRSIDNGNIKR